MKYFLPLFFVMFLKLCWSQDTVKVGFSYENMIEEELMILKRFNESDSIIPGILTDPCFELKHEYQKQYWMHQNYISLRVLLLANINDINLLNKMYLYSIRNILLECSAGVDVPFKDWSLSDLIQKRIHELSGDEYIRTR